MDNPTIEIAYIELLCKKYYAEVWDAAIRHLWALSDPANTVIDTEDSRYIAVSNDVAQALVENPYRV